MCHWLRRVFQAFEKYCKVDNGYVVTPDVTRVPPAHDETMQSFFLAVRTILCTTLFWLQAV
jgi:Glycosyl hydrolase family 47